MMMSERKKHGQTCFRDGSAWYGGAGCRPKMGSASLEPHSGVASKNGSEGKSSQCLRAMHVMDLPMCVESGWPKDGDTGSWAVHMAWLVGQEPG